MFTELNQFPKSFPISSLHISYYISVIFWVSAPITSLHSGSFWVKTLKKSVNLHIFGIAFLNKMG